MSLGWPEIVLILLVVLMLFGANRIPEIARSLGKALRCGSAHAPRRSVAG